RRTGRPAWVGRSPALTAPRLRTTGIWTPRKYGIRMTSQQTHPEHADPIEPHAEPLHRSRFLTLVLALCLGGVAAVLRVRSHVPSPEGDFLTGALLGVLLTYRHQEKSRVSRVRTYVVNVLLMGSAFVLSWSIVQPLDSA